MLYHSNITKTHDIIEKHIHKAAVYTDEINGRGPRYCPSIEEKIDASQMAFTSDIYRTRGIDTNEVYPSGISTSLPADVQTMFIRSIAGLEHAHITRFAMLLNTTSLIPETYTHGLRANIWAVLGWPNQWYNRIRRSRHKASLLTQCHVNQEDYWYPCHEAYIGVLLDDLTTKGAPEPTVFTSRQNID